MTNGKKSEDMTIDELYVQRMLCPDCGKQGMESGRIAEKNFEWVLIGGLDLEGCEGCRRVLAARGGAIIGKIHDASTGSL